MLSVVDGAELTVNVLVVGSQDINEVGEVIWILTEGNVNNQEVMRVEPTLNHLDGKDGVGGNVDTETEVVAQPPILPNDNRVDVFEIFAIPKCLTKPVNMSRLTLPLPLTLVKDCS